VRDDYSRVLDEIKKLVNSAKGSRLTISVTRLKSRLEDISHMKIFHALNHIILTVFPHECVETYYSHVGERSYRVRWVIDIKCLKRYRDISGVT